MNSTGGSAAAESTWEHSWSGPAWIAIAVGVVLTVLWIWMYRREVAWNVTKSRHLLVALRIAASWLLIWTMFGWLEQQHRTEPADLIVGIDDSASMSLADEESESAAKAMFNRMLPPEQVQKPSRFQIAQGLIRHPDLKWTEALNNQYQLKWMLIADSPREISGDSSAFPAAISTQVAERPASRIGSNLRAIVESQRGRPTAAIVLLTDGNTTDGESIVEAAQLARLRAIPLYLVGIGSDKPVRDLRLSRLLADDVAFIDDLVTISCQLTATGFAGKKTTAQLKRTDTDEVLAAQSVVVPAENDQVAIQLSFRATAVGEVPLRVIAAALPGEANIDNNQLSHRVTVQDSQTRVLHVQASPSYEYRYLNNLLTRAINSSGEKSFQLTTILQDAERDPSESGSNLALFPLRQQELWQYDAIVLGDADPAFLGEAAAKNVLDFVRQRGGGVVFIAGPRFMPLAYRNSPLSELFPFDVTTVTAPADGVATEPLRAQLTSIGKLFPPCQLVANPDENVRLWNSLPSLFWNVDIPNASPGARVLLQHPTRSAPNGQKLPLVLLHYFGAGRVLFHATDESYRWSRYEGSDEYYARYWTQMIRMISRAKLLIDRSPAEISIDRANYEEGDEIAVRVHFWQPGVAPRASESVIVILEREDGIRQSVSLQSQTNNPALFVGSFSGLASGSYRVWLSSPTLNPAPNPRSFIIEPTTKERILRPMNATELNQAAKISRGRFYTLKNVNQLVGDLPRGQRVRIESLPPQPIWNSPFIAATFVLLLAAEWVLRRRAGWL